MCHLSLPQMEIEPSLCQCQCCSWAVPQVHEGEIGFIQLCHTWPVEPSSLVKGTGRMERQLKAERHGYFWQFSGIKIQIGQGNTLFLNKRLEAYVTYSHSTSSRSTSTTPSLLPPSNRGEGPLLCIHRRKRQSWAWLNQITNPAPVNIKTLL